MEEIESYEKICFCCLNIDKFLPFSLEHVPSFVQSES